MADPLTVRVKDGDAGTRADRFLASRLDDFSRSALKRLFDTGQITLDGKAVSAHRLTREGEEFTVEIPQPLEAKAKPEKIELAIVFEDSEIVIVNKAAGMVVHPAKGHHTGTLVNALLYHCKDLSGIGGEIRPGIVHRLDKESTGLIAVAKTDAAHASLSAQLADRSMGREYLAVVVGPMKDDSGAIDIPIGRHPVYRKKISVKTDRPRNAVTHYETLERFKEAAYIKAKLVTGRTHQIRVHMAAIGHPLIGDSLYGKKKSSMIARPALHAYKLTLIHPGTGKVEIFTADPPADFIKLLAALREADRE